jgi:release factor glutamine methyltransferase
MSALKDERLKTATVAALLDDASARIVAALGLEKREARLEARVLAAQVLAVDAAWLIAHDTDLLDPAQIKAFDTLLTRRLAGEPIAHLMGRREFYGRSFEVSPDVLIPRPDTELLVDLALERPLARVTAVDRSAAALAIAQRNADILNAHVEFLVSDWFAALSGRSFDLIVSNPPYITAADPHLARGDVRFEPLTALVAGHDGLDDLRRLTGDAPAHLKPGGTLLLEHGYDQADAVQLLLRKSGFRRPRSWADLSGILRVSGGELSE